MVAFVSLGLDGQHHARGERLAHEGQRRLRLGRAGLGLHRRADGADLLAEVRRGRGEDGHAALGRALLYVRSNSKSERIFF